MVTASRNPGLRRRTWLGAFLVYVFALLPMLGAAHQHEENADHAGHSACQLCLSQGQVYEPAVPPVLPAAASILLFLIPEDSPRALQALPVAHESRGPPSA